MAELMHSVLSARDAGAGGDPFDIVVYADDHGVPEGLPARVVRLDAHLLSEWAGPQRFGHRRKICLVRHALASLGGPVIFCDTDTYFVDSPGRLFSRIQPGTTLMHAREGSPEDLGVNELASLLREHRLTMRDGSRWAISPATPIVNSGVIGLHAADAPVLDEVLHLCDQISARLSYFGTEQFAFSACFGHLTTLLQADDCVFHYWHPTLRNRFHARMAPVLRDASRGSLSERFRQVAPMREQVFDRPETVRRHLYVWLWRLADRLGVVDVLHRARGGAGTGRPPT
jgi:hypothetical protein